MRATLDSVIARNTQLKVSAKAARDHGSIQRKGFRPAAVADVVRASAAAHDLGVR